MDNSSSQDKFMFSQYSALRKEILDIKNRIIKMMGYGLVGVPLLIASAQKWDLYLILAFSPFIVVIVVFMVIFEQFSLMRAGAYINQYIETYFISEQATIPGKNIKLRGWEQWLEEKTHVRETRTPEKYFIFSFYILCIIYYIAAAIIGFKIINEQYVTILPNIHIIAISVYTVGFVLLIVRLVSIHSGLSSHDLFK